MKRERHDAHTRSPCVYCGRPADSKEDWFPRWLGRYRNVGLLTGRICRGCNNALGEQLDQVMSRESPEALNRDALGISGRHVSDKRNVFSHKSQAAEPPTTATVDAPDLDFEPLRQDDFSSGELISAWRVQVVLRDSQSIPYPIGLTPGVPDDWLFKAIQNRRIGSSRVSDIVCNPENPTDPADQWQIPAWIRILLFRAVANVREQAQTFGIRVIWLTADGVKRVVLRSTTRLALSKEYYRALAKIAFHYVLKVDRDLDGRETQFEGVRRFIRYGEGDPYSFVRLDARKFVIDSGYTIRGVHHFLFEDISHANHICVRMHFFLKGPYPMLTLPTLVTLGRDPFVRGPRCAHAFRLYPESIDGFNGEMVPAEIRVVDGLKGVMPPPWAGGGIRVSR